MADESDRERITERGPRRGTERPACSGCAIENLLRLERPPRHRPHTADSEAGSHDRAVLDPQRRGRGGERKLERGSVAHLQISGPRADRRQRNSDPRDELAVLQHVLDVRPVSR
jgi:hypothetical protein